MNTSLLEKIHRVLLGFKPIPECATLYSRVSDNSLHAALLIIPIVCLLFERIANDLVNDTQVYSLFVAFICQSFIR